MCWNAEIVSSAWTNQFMFQPSQRYVHYIMESAQYLYQDVSTMNNFFNWTMTYRCRIRTFSYKGFVLFIQEGFWLLSSLRKDCEGEGAPRGRAAEGVHQKIWPRQQASGTGQTQTGGLVCQPLRNTGNTVCYLTSDIKKPLKACWSTSGVPT